VTLIKLQIVWGIGLILRRQQLITLLGINGEFASGIFGKITPRESGQTSLWSFLTRESGKPAKEEKQMTTEKFRWCSL